MLGPSVDLRSHSGDDNDRIYEDIEAPKFVDFTKLDNSRTDDPSWFCARIGCNQDHEEVDPDALHKSFILRVMAARSPNVRLQRSLSRRAQSGIPRCPLTAPVKSSKVAKKLNSTDSVPEKIKSHPIASLRSTPVAKGLTTPEVRQCGISQGRLRSVHSLKTQDPTPKSKVKVASKVPNSKKDQNTTSSACCTRVSQMCSELSKLQIGSKVTVSQNLCKSLKSSNDPHCGGKKNVDNMDVDRNSGSNSSACTDDDKENASDNNMKDITNSKEENIDRRISSKMVVGEKNEVDVRDNSLISDDNKENALVACVGDSDTKTEVTDNENCEKIPKMTEAPLKSNQDISVRSGKYKKSKAITNPKPFRFRTDERGVLKEANLERRAQVDAALKETPATKVKSEITYTPQRRKLDNSLETATTKPQKIRKLASSQKPAKTTSCRTTDKKVATNKGAEDDISGPKAADTTRRTPSSRTRWTPTIPKGPNFHRIHVPKGCTKRLEGESPIAF